MEIPDRAGAIQGIGISIPPAFINHSRQAGGKTNFKWEIPPLADTAKPFVQKDQRRHGNAGGVTGRFYDFNGKAVTAVMNVKFTPQQGF
jgi:hypothetical protein